MKQLIKYIDSNENGICNIGFFIEDEINGTILKVDKKIENEN